jgi:hypothetical protein
MHVDLNRFLNINKILEKNWVFNFLVIFLVIIALFFNLKALINIYNFQRLNSFCKVNEVNFYVEEIKGKYKIAGSYRFESDKKTISGKNFFKESFLNQFAAQEAIKNLPKERLVFFDPKHPEISTLEKSFPYKNVIYALIALGVAIYFGFFKFFFFKQEDL